MGAESTAGHWRRDVDFGAHTWREIEQLARSGTVVVIPSGAVEVYGPHLPLASDSIVADAVAHAVAQRLGALCAPLIAVGNSRDLMSFPGTLTVEPTAFLAYLDGVCRSLLHWGFTDLLFLNTHAGNVGLIDQLGTSLVEQAGARCLTIDWWRYCGRLGADLIGRRPLGRGSRR